MRTLSLSDLPDDPTAWTLQDIHQVVQFSVFEPDDYDYREVMERGPRDRARHREAIQRTACAMANSTAGFMLFGIRERDVRVSIWDERIVGLRIGTDFGRAFAEIVSGIQPGIEFTAMPAPVPLPERPGRGVFVVRISNRPRRLHRLSGVVYVRAAGGDNVPLDAAEIRRSGLSTR